MGVNAGSVLLVLLWYALLLIQVLAVVYVM